MGRYGHAALLLFGLFGMTAAGAELAAANECSAHEDESALLQRPRRDADRSGAFGAASALSQQHATPVVKSRTEALWPAKPPPGSDQLWGGPSIAWSQKQFTREVFAPADAASVMDFAGPNSSVPEGLWGVFWMDQYGFSSIAKDPSYPYKMIGTPEILASFGSAAYEEATGCVTPVTLYGGSDWSFINGKGGDQASAAHTTSRNTLSFCYKDSSLIKIRQKQLTEQASVGPVTVGSVGAWLFDFKDAGNGYSWVPSYLLDMEMVKTSWGWDRVTLVGRATNPNDHSFIGKLLLAGLSKMIPESHYPLIQIVDGNGKPTPYMKEFLAYMKTKGKDLYYNKPT